jgi:hypothetical protein
MCCRRRLQVFLAALQYQIIIILVGLLSFAERSRQSALFVLLVSLATLPEVFPCFFLSCKANARVKPAKTGHGPHSS